MAGYTLKLKLEALNAEGSRMSFTDHAYENLSYENLVHIQRTLLHALLKLGDDKVAADKAAGPNKAPGKPA